MDFDCADCEPLGPPPRAMHDRLGLLLVRTGEHLVQQASEALATLEIDPRDYVALALLASDQPRSQSELAQLLGKAPAIVVDLVDHLESLGLARRDRDPQDRRRSVVGITDEGRARLARADELVAQVEQRGLAGLDDDQRALLHELLQQAAVETRPEGAATAPA
jgi:MarR family transcriptional regulator, lower aerobic nicotinate degradation pathway regulator